MVLFVSNWGHILHSASAVLGFGRREHKSSKMNEIWNNMSKSLYIVVSANSKVLFFSKLESVLGFGRRKHKSFKINEIWNKMLKSLLLLYLQIVRFFLLTHWKHILTSQSNTILSIEKGLNEMDDMYVEIETFYLRG